MQKPIEILRRNKKPKDDLLCHPLQSVPNLDLVREKWKAVEETIRASVLKAGVVDVADVDDKRPLLREVHSVDRLTKASNFWQGYFQDHEEFWLDKDDATPRADLRPRETPISSITKDLTKLFTTTQIETQDPKYEQAKEYLEILDNTFVATAAQMIEPDTHLRTLAGLVIEAEAKAGPTLKDLTSAHPLHLWVGNDKPHSRYVELQMVSMLFYTFC